jgi:uncharacterized membrane protein YfcA
VKYPAICLTAFIASGLTLFSGFGLGTLLLPVLALFFPIEVAVALTAVVHLFNNLFKLALLGKHAEKTVVVRFGVPAILAALVGAQALFWLSHLQPWLTYQLGDQEFHLMPVKLVVACLMVVFASLELLPQLERISFEQKYLPLGGLLSGFFGGLSGHQGALRSAFLIRYGLSKEAFIATGVVIACLVDFSRLLVYSTKFSWATMTHDGWLLGAALLSAFSGAFMGNLLLKKVTLRTLQIMVSVMILLIALGLGAGLL